MSNFSFSHIVFSSISRTFCHFHEIQNCRLQTSLVLKSLKLVVWERVKLQQILELSKFKAFADNNLKMTQMMK